MKKRKDRRSHIENEFKDFENVERIEAVDTSQTYESGYYGCVLSHIKALERAKEKDYDEVMICEDDYQWVNKDEFIYPPPEVVEFDICLLECIYMKHEKLSSNYNKIWEAQHCGCYIIKKHFYDTLIDEFKTSHEKLQEKFIYTNFHDVHWYRIQEDNMFITPRIKIGKQLEGYSDIKKKVMKR